MKEFLKILLFFLVLVLVVLLFAFRKLGQSGKKDRYKAIRGTMKEETASTVDADKKETCNLLQRYNESRLKLEEAKGNKDYAVLFENLIPRMQQLMGLAYYRLDIASKDKLLEDLNYLVGINLNNELFNLGFRLNEQGILEYLRINRSQEEQPSQNRSEAELMQLIARNDNERSRLSIYKERKELCAALVKSIQQLRKMIALEQVDILEIRKEIHGIDNSFHRYGFEFKYYEDFSESSLDAKQFLIGDEWSLDYPALYQNGALYCDNVGRKKVS